MPDINTAGAAALLGPDRIVFYDTQGTVTVQDLITGETLETVQRPPPAILSVESALAGSPDGKHYAVGAFPVTPQLAEYGFAYVYTVGKVRSITDIKFFDNTDPQRPIVYADRVEFVPLRDDGYVLSQHGLCWFGVNDSKLQLRIDGTWVADVSPGMEKVGRAAASGMWLACVMSGSPNRVFWWNYDTRNVHSCVVGVGAVTHMVLSPEGYAVVWGSRGHYVAHPHKKPVRIKSAGRRLPALGVSAVFNETTHMPWPMLKQVLLGHRQESCELSKLPRDMLRLILENMSTIRFTSMSVPYVSISYERDSRMYRAQHLCVYPDSGSLWVETQPGKCK